MKLFILFVVGVILSGVVCKSQTKEEYIELGLYWANKHDYAKAIKVYDEAIQKYGNDAEFYVLRGEQKGKVYIGEIPENVGVPLLNNPNFKEALADLNKAILLDKTSSHAYYCRGNLYLDYLMFDEAINDFTKELICADNDHKFNGYQGRAIARLKKGDIDGAMADCNKALEIDPKNFGIYVNIALVYRAQKDYVKTEEFLRKALAIDSTQVILWNNIGFIKIEQENYKTALAIFLKLYQKNHNDPLILSNLGFAQGKLGDIETGLKNIDASLALYPGNSFAYKYKGLLYMDMHREQDACNAFRKAIELGYLKSYGNDLNELINKYCK